MVRDPNNSRHIYKTLHIGSESIVEEEKDCKSQNNRKFDVGFSILTKSEAAPVKFPQHDYPNTS